MFPFYIIKKKKNFISALEYKRRKRDEEAAILQEQIELRENYLRKQAEIERNAEKQLVELVQAELMKQQSDTETKKVLTCMEQSCVAYFCF